MDSRLCWTFVFLLLGLSSDLIGGVDPEGLPQDKSGSNILKNVPPPNNDGAADLSKIDVQKKVSDENADKIDLNKKAPNNLSNDADNKDPNKPIDATNKSPNEAANVNDPNANLFQAGAVTRFILVLVALTFLFLLYAGFKTYRKRNRKSKRRTVVRRYGGRKNDVEMEPLPLSDEDDETIFDIHGTGSNK